jgi:hypothetical protein
MNLLQLAPFGLLLLLSLLSSLPIGGEATPYSLRPADSYTLQRSTEGAGVTYFVAESFELRHTDSEALRQVEDRIEAEALQRGARWPTRRTSPKAGRTRHLEASKGLARQCHALAAAAPHAAPWPLHVFYSPGSPDLDLARLSRARQCAGAAPPSVRASSAWSTSPTRTRALSAHACLRPPTL